MGRRSSLRVILISGDPERRQALTTMLRGIPDVALLGEASDGQYAVMMARAFRPDAVLMDIDMPVMNGLHATRIIRNEYPDTRVIGLALAHSPHHVQAMSEAGATACATSPAMISELLSELLSAAVRQNRSALTPSPQ